MSPLPTLPRETQLQADAAAGDSVEFCLLMLCLRWPWSAGTLDAIHAAAEQVTDWPRLLRIAARHRVTGLLYRACLRAEVALPVEVKRELEQTTSAQTRQTMTFAFESARLQRLFHDAGIDLIFLKGVALTLLAYGDLSLRHAKDIDLLISLEDAEAASVLLGAAGYEPRFRPEAMSPSQYALWLRHSKGMEWWNGATGVEIEVHWRLTDMPSLLPDALASDQRQRVAIGGGMALTTLDRDHLFAFLCVHGASHGWSRLKWLADIYALLPQDRPEERLRLYHRAVELGAARPAGQALMLCRELLGMPIEARLLQDFEGDWALPLLTKAALITIRRGGSEREIYDQPFGTTFIYLARFLLGDGWGFLFSEARQRAYPPDRIASSHLHRRLIFLFPVLRLWDWMLDRMRHGGRSER